MSSYPVTAEDKRWRAESDARTLAEATVIQKDAQRMKAATEAAARMAEEQRKEAAAMTSVARRKGNTGSGGIVKGGAKKPNTSEKVSGNKNKFNVFEKI